MAMKKFGDVIRMIVPVAGDSTGNIDADSTPVGAFVHNGTIDGGVTVTVTRMTTGLYLLSATIPNAGGGYAVGDDVWIQATVVSGQTFYTVSTVYTLDSKRTSELNDTSAAAAGSAAATAILATPANKLASDSSGNVTVGNYATGKSPDEQILFATGKKILADNSGNVLLGTTILNNIFGQTLGTFSSPASGSVGHAIYAMYHLFGARNELAQDGGSTTTIKLNTSASSTDSYYNGQKIVIVNGAGVGQVGYITGYVGSTRVATVSSAWAIAPDSTSEYMLMPLGEPVNFAKMGIGTNGHVTTVDSVTNIDLSPVATAAALSTLQASVNTLGTTPLATASALATAQSALTAIGNKTVNLPNNPAAVGSAMTLSASALHSMDLSDPGAGMASTLEGLIVQIWRAQYGPQRMTSSYWDRLSDAGSINFRQSLTDDGTTQSVSKPI